MISILNYSLRKLNDQKKKENVVISGIDLDSLKEGESVLSIITNQIDSVDESATIVDCKRLIDTNKYINKVIDTFNNTLLRDKIINKSKFVLKWRS